MQVQSPKIHNKANYSNFLDVIFHALPHLKSRKHTLSEQWKTKFIANAVEQKVSWKYFSTGVGK